MLRRLYNAQDISRCAAWHKLIEENVSFEIEGRKFVVRNHDWRRDHTYQESWEWYAKRIQYDGVPRQTCPIPEELWPQGYEWATWVGYDQAACCGFELETYRRGTP